MMENVLRERFAGIDRLYGRGSTQILSGKHVCVVGLGGVGSWAGGALARSAIGRLILIDADEICLSNSNRQLFALDGQFGRGKAEVLAERCRAINPKLGVDIIPSFLTSTNLESLLGRDHDLVLDACDSFRS